MDCSAIITCCNEYPKVLFTVQSIIEELRDFGNFEVIVVDNKSTDRTKEYFKNNRHPNIKFFEYDKKYSHWQAKNLGVEKAKGKYLFFLDAHCIVGRGSLIKMKVFLENMEDNGMKIGGVHMLHSPILMEKKFQHASQPKFIYRFRVAEVGKDKPYEVFGMSTCGMMSPKKVFNKLGGWNKELGQKWGGEAYINLKQATCGYPQFIHPEARYFHYKGKMSGWIE